jgi:hypothetical protein
VKTPEYLKVMALEREKFLKK